MKSIKWKSLYSNSEKKSSSSKIYVGPVKTINNPDPNMFNTNKYPSCRPIRHYRERFVKSSNKIAHKRFGIPNGIIEKSTDKCTITEVYNHYLTKINKKDNCSEVDINSNIKTCTIKKKKQIVINGATDNSKQYCKHDNYYHSTENLLYSNGVNSSELNNPINNINSNNNYNTTFYKKTNCNNINSYKQNNIIYKPQNINYGLNNAVSSSSRTARLKFNNIENMNKLNINSSMIEGALPNQHFILKDKSFGCSLLNIHKHANINKNTLLCNKEDTEYITINGIFKETELLTANVNFINIFKLNKTRINKDTIKYIWKRNNINISTNNTNTYLLSQDDVNNRISVTLLYRGFNNKNYSFTSILTPPILNVNDAPITKDIDTFMNEDEGTIEIELQGNDIDGDNLMYIITVPPANGNYNLIGNKLFYTPNENYNGNDSIIYRATDNKLFSNESIIHITIHPINDNPVTNNVIKSLHEDDKNVLINLLTNDIDNDNLTYHIQDKPKNGNAIVINKIINYTPNPNYNGSDSITYYVNDGIVNSNISTINLTIYEKNDAPITENIDISMNENGENGGTAYIVLQGSDIDNSDLAYIIVNEPNHGTYTLTDNIVSYTPDENYNGSDTITYKANDGQLDSNISTINIYINNTPVTQDIETLMNENEGTRDIELGGIDIDDSNLTYIIVNGPSHGTYILNDNILSYTPDENYNGIDTITYKANDGKVDSNVSSITIYINDLPITTDINISMIEDEGTRDIALQGSDIDNSNLTYSIVNGPSHGTYILTNNIVSYTPDENYNGIDTITYKANDGKVDSNVSTISINITPVNDTPIAQDIDISMNEDEGTRDIILQGSDIDNSNLTYSIINGPSHGTYTLNDNILSYTPDENYNGSDTITYKANDGELDSNILTITINITPVNDRPIAQDKNLTVNEDSFFNRINLQGTDVENNNNLTYIITKLPDNGIIKNNNTTISDINISIIGNEIIYFPHHNYFGNDTITYKTNDGELDSNIAIININIINVNDRPNNPRTLSTNVELGNQISLTLSANDVDNDELTYRITSNPGNGIIDIQKNVLYYTGRERGNHTLKYVANDGNIDSPEADINIVVN